ncbi:alpha-ribazole phosphatase [Paramaledivibacter caminithermalis]|jgi:alpha-ribazole phosphatase|uniref:Alpha-ribazole phosphatase n=1 Tax=Paramaledivibacter caminithermalis (strain DSM 15212 / CIP 107654 / DViRD3) TaxID=1121301 RepID=A0A1M6MM15_PARC5|nr:alpha-ribazole phosphatase [Paramaledivibacter caminithermalis]SHJ84420.1 alpha-ribazole phosphatase [Paramaledivibacter caminithermalis DSM 15212]
MLEIIFVRHGESEMNRNNMYCGWTNSSLTEKGLRQAERVSEKLADEAIDLIISSDLDRCFKTAAIINRLHRKTIIKETALRELNFGAWEGLTYHEICRDFPQEIKKWQEDFINFKIPEGESLLKMHKRVNKAFGRIINEHKEGKILIVSHSGVIRSILTQQLLGSIDGYWKFKIKNCGITRMEIMDNFLVLVGMNQ